MVPGKHAVRVVGGGSAYLTVAKSEAIDFDIGRPYYIVTQNTGPSSALEWKVPGHDWEPVPKTFLYPPEGVPYK